MAGFRTKGDLFNMSDVACSALQMISICVVLGLLEGSKSESCSGHVSD